VLSLAWPSSAWMTRISTPSSSKCVAKLCRKVCGPTRLAMSAAAAASTTTRYSCRVLIGTIAFRPGKSQPSA
jgi:hypothetical protein